MRKKNTQTKRKKLEKKTDEVSIEYVFPLGGNGWMIKHNKAAKFTLITDSRREAISIARSIAKRKQRVLVVYGRDHKIAIRENYIAAS